MKCKTAVALANELPVNVCNIIGDYINLYCKTCCFLKEKEHMFMDSRDLPEEGLQKTELHVLLFTWFNINNMKKLLHNCCHKDLKTQIDTLFDKEEVKERLKNRKMYYQAIKSYCKNNIDNVKTVLIHSREINLLQAGKTIRVLPN